MDPTSGDGFIFVNKRRTLIKILVWDRNGYVIYYKRLEKGTIEIPKGSDNYIPVSTLVMMLEGIDIESVTRRKRYSKQVEIRA